jgi:signal transduction histidine kinase
MNKQIENKAMKYRTKLILLMGFGTLVVLVGILGYSAFQRAEQIYNDVSAIHESFQRRSSILYDIQTETLMSGILVRDYLLDPLPASGTQHRKDLLDLASSMDKHIAELAALMRQDEGDAFKRLHSELTAYCDSLDPIFDWTPAQKAALSTSFLRKAIFSRREARISLTREIDELNTASFKREQQNIRGKRGQLRSYLGKMFVLALCFSLVVAAVSFSRISNLERHREEEQIRAETAERELRRLSLKLVRTQEDERKSISRELHDEIGQMITGLRMELTNIHALRTAPEAEFAQHMSEAKSLAEKTLQSLRNLAMGLRPTMLDDLGLGPALQWQAKEFSRRSGVPAMVQLDGNLDGIEEGLRTCVYRLVQESLTNCARHSQANCIIISAIESNNGIVITIQDDGIGFDANALRHRGLGLMGMEERVRELGGGFAVTSQISGGTAVRAEIPIRKGSANA